MKKFILYTLLFFIVLSVAYIGISNINYSTGTRAGSILKFSKKGYVFKTYEGTVNLEFINTQAGKLVGNTWDFSVSEKNKGLIDSLMSHGQNSLRFYYKEQLRALPWEGETKYFVYRIEELESREKGMRNF